MTKVRFLKVDGSLDREVDVPIGSNLLDVAWGVMRTSRLACQIILTEDLGTLTVKMPGGFHNWQGR